MNYQLLNIVDYVYEFIDEKLLSISNTRRINIYSKFLSISKLNKLYNFQFEDEKDDKLTSISIFQNFISEQTDLFIQLNKSHGQKYKKLGITEYFKNALQSLTNITDWIQQHSTNYFFLVEEDIQAYNKVIETLKEAIGNDENDETVGKILNNMKKQYESMDKKFSVKLSQISNPLIRM
jgi:hypothetical protein